MIGIGKEQGNTLNAILNNSWTNKKEVSDIGRLSDKVTQTLIKSGSAGVGWNALKRDPKRPLSDFENELKHYYQSLSIQEVLDNDKLTGIGKIFSKAGIAAILFKGRAIAEYYRPTYIRPTGDIDVIVLEHQFELAVACLDQWSVMQHVEPNGDRVITLDNAAGGVCSVDLHKNLERFGFDSLDSLFSHAVKLDFGADATLYRPSLEHHIRLVTIHFFRHGGWRPLWLCDIAALMDEIDEDFDWARCLGEDKILAQWIIQGMMLAQKMIGAKSVNYPKPFSATRPSKRLIATINKEWNQLLGNRLRHPKFVNIDNTKERLSEIKARWPNPITALISMHKPPNHKPVIFYQSLYFVKKCGAHFLKSRN